MWLDSGFIGIVGCWVLGSLPMWRKGPKLEKFMSHLIQWKGVINSIHVFHRAVTVNSALQIRSPLDRAEIFTAGSGLIALHSDRSDR